MPIERTLLLITFGGGGKIIQYWVGKYPDEKFG
jgi:hypothetical protein